MNEHTKNFTDDTRICIGLKLLQELLKYVLYRFQKNLAQGKVYVKVWYCEKFKYQY